MSANEAVHYVVTWRLAVKLLASANASRGGTSEAAGYRKASIDQRELVVDASGAFAT